MIPDVHIANLPLAVWPMAFGSLGMLLIGISAAVPVVIHLLSRRRYNEMAWAAMEYLLAAMRKNARRIQLEQLLQRPGLVQREPTRKHGQSQAAQSDEEPRHHRLVGDESWPERGIEVAVEPVIKGRVLVLHCPAEGVLGLGSFAGSELDNRFQKDRENEAELRPVNTKIRKQCQTPPAQCVG